MDKKEIRNEIRQRLKGLDVEIRRAESQRIFEAVERLPRFASADVVALFLSLPDEPQTRSFAERWYKRKRIVVPRVCGEEMEFFDYHPDRLRKGAFGIEEPDNDAAPCRTGEIDFMVVPAVAFTRYGRRLGRGGGFYDRYMSHPAFRAFAAGVCFSVQVVEDLPVEPHDRAVDTVISGDNIQS